MIMLPLFYKIIQYIHLSECKITAQMFKMSDHMSVKVMGTQMKSKSMIRLNLSGFKMEKIKSCSHSHTNVVFLRVHGEWVGLSLGG